MIIERPSEHITLEIGIYVHNTARFPKRTLAPPVNGFWPKSGHVSAGFPEFSRQMPFVDPWLPTSGRCLSTLDR
ncbi:hypothetical protein ABIA33_000965 [Streptacidiphilus sp. MAP12-16]|jgi:hypothetical protein